MLSRILFLFLVLHPLLSFAQKDINLNDLELEDIEIPSLSDLEVLEQGKTPYHYPPSKDVVLEKKGGIHEKMPKVFYPEKPGMEEKINWSENVLPSKNESFYLYFSAGYGNISYYGSISSTNNPALDLNLFGVYWPKFNHSFMVGMIFELTVNNFSIDQSSANILQPALSLSMEYFFGQNIGSGLFARWDLGFGSVAYLKNETSAYVLDYRLGPSMLIGTGYAIPFSHEARLLINLSYVKKVQTYENASNGSDSLLLTGGILF